MNDNKNVKLDNAIKLLSGKNFWQSNDIAENDIPSIRFSDGPHGLRLQEKKADHLGLGDATLSTCFPTASATACSFDCNLLQEVGRAIGEEAASHGVNVVLGPGLNIKRSPLCGRNFEYFSEDAYLSGMLATAYVQGVQQTGVSACVKHYACNGREYGRMVYDAVIDERTLRELYLTGFEMVIKNARPHALMTAYNRVNGQYCFMNEHLIGDILRGEWKYDGLVVSDWGGSYDLAEGVRVGSDLEMPACYFGKDEVEKALNEQRLTPEQVQKSANRVATLAQTGRDSLPAIPLKNQHDLLSERAAEECCVLLKNDGVLPLKGEEKLALVGDFAFDPVVQGGGSSHVNCGKVPNLLEAFAAESVALVGAERGFYKSGKSSLSRKRRAIALCRRADTIIYCMGTADEELVEGYDRTNLNLKRVQTELLQAIYALHKRVIVVLFCGDVVATDWDGNASAVLLAGYGGQGVCHAVCRILTGKVNPSGKLAQTWYERTEEVPYSKTYAPDVFTAPHAEGLNVGYRSAAGLAAKYPFGHGLSYTTFAYSDLKVEENGVSFTLKNTGTRIGTEIAMLFVKSPVAPDTPRLQGFTRVTLQPLQEQRVRLPFDEFTFRAYVGGWNVFAGEYTLFVGGSATNLPLKASIEMTGNPLPKDMPLPITWHERKNEEGKQGKSQRIEEGKQGKSQRIEEGKQGKKQRIEADWSTPVARMKYAKGWFGRAFYYCVIAFGKLSGKTVSGSVEYLPFRSLMQFMGLNLCQAEGFLAMVNGKFFYGLKKLKQKGET